MWGEMMPKRGIPEYSARISSQSLELLGSEDDHMFMLVLCPYMGLDWRGCANIPFTLNEPPIDRWRDKVGKRGIGK